MILLISSFKLSYSIGRFILLAETYLPKEQNYFKLEISTKMTTTNFKYICKQQYQGHGNYRHGDFNQTNLKTALPVFYQFVSWSLRGESYTTSLYHVSQWKPNTF